MALRTGPADLSKRLVTPKAKAGLLPDGLHVHRGAVRDGDGVVIPTPTEAAFFELLGLPWEKPRYRTPRAERVQQSEIS